MIGLLLLLACNPEPAPVAAPLPSDSLYVLDVDLVDQHGAAVDLGVHRGHPTIVSMFYASCPMACPLLIEDVRSVEGLLTPAERADLRVLLVSLDPANDTPEALAAVVSKHGVDDARWTLARPLPDDVRPIATVLGIAYASDGAGGMNHSSILTLVDADGRVIARLDGIDADPTPLLEALRTAPRG